MPFKIKITAAAIIDLEEGFAYYNSRVANLGYKFIDEVHLSLNNIADRPFSFGERYKVVRGKLVSVFPYLIMLRIDEVRSTVEILRIFNTYQNPAWR